MKQLLLIITCLSFSLGILAQQSVLVQIEQNNTVLAALRKQADAEKIGNKTGIYLENPEVEFHYLWGNDSETRTDWAASQSFDFPTAYYHKRKVSDSQNKQVDLKYLIERKDILLEAQSVCIQLIYQNALSIELKKQYDLTLQVADAYETKYKTGDASVLDLNKAKFDLLNAQKDYNASMTEKEFLQSELVRLNGGNPIDFSFTEFPRILLPPDFEGWYAVQKDKNSQLRYYQQEVFLSKQSEKLQRSMNLPKLSAGYMSEKVAAAEHFQGVTVGISIPLFENKNTVKQIKAQTFANKELEIDASLRDYHQSEALYKKVMNLQQILNDFKTYQLSDDTAVLLKKSLDAGEISLIEFITELGIYYSLVKDMLETERDLNLTFTELMQWEL